MKLSKIYFLLFSLFISSIAICNELDSLNNLIPSSPPAEQIQLYNQIGKNYYQRGDYANALGNFSQALEIAQTINDSLYIAKMFSNIGVIKDIVGNYSEAIDNYQKSLSIYDKLNNKEGKESVLNNIGIVYEEMGESEK